MSVLQYVLVYFFTSGFLWEDTRVLHGDLYFYDGIHVSKRYEGWAGHSAAFWVYLHLLPLRAYTSDSIGQDFSIHEEKTIHTYTFHHLPLLFFLVSTRYAG